MYSYKIRPVSSESIRTRIHSPFKMPKFCFKKTCCLPSFESCNCFFLHSVCLQLHTLTNARLNLVDSAALLHCELTNDDAAFGLMALSSNADVGAASSTRFKVHSVFAPTEAQKRKQRWRCSIYKRWVDTATF